MHRRLSNKIDIYMGNDVQAARDFGERQLRISW
jgi:3D (Asp-Asp-Asp) domain-containing protein